MSRLCVELLCSTKQKTISSTEKQVTGKSGHFAGVAQDTGWIHYDPGNAKLSPNSILFHNYWLSFFFYLKTSGSIEGLWRWEPRGVSLFNTLSSRTNAEDVYAPWPGHPFLQRPAHRAQGVCTLWGKTRDKCCRAKPSVYHIRRDKCIVWNREKRISKVECWAERARPGAWFHLQWSEVRRHPKPVTVLLQRTHAHGLCWLLLQEQGRPQWGRRGCLGAGRVPCSQAQWSTHIWWCYYSSCERLFCTIFYIYDLFCNYILIRLSLE